MHSLILDNGIFRGEVIPEIGSNIVCLRHLKSGTRLLQEPGDLNELERFPARFGLPVLFPPTRIKDGRFLFEGRWYHLPITESATNNHLHGLVLNKSWEVISHTNHEAVLQFVFTQASPEYEGFPFEFTLKRNLELTESGLIDRMTISNDGLRNMPLGLGYHSTFPAKPSMVRLSTASMQFEIGERFLPTGAYLPWKEFDPRQWFNPCGINVGFHARAEKMILEDGTTLHGAEIQYETGLLQYLTDEKFGFWYTWNKRGEGDFISLEPISWMANALNMPDFPEEIGIRILAPGTQSTFQCELRFFEKTRSLEL